MINHLIEFSGFLKIMNFLLHFLMKDIHGLMLSGINMRYKAFNHKIKMTYR